MQVAGCSPATTLTRLTPLTVDPEPTSALPTRVGRRWSVIRAFVLSRDGSVCQYCGQPAAHVDHVTPVRAGGQDTLGNLVAACRDCNTRKGCHMFDSFEAAKLWLSNLTNVCSNPAHSYQNSGGRRVSLVDELRAQRRLEDDMSHGYMGSNYTKSEWLSIQRAKKRRA